MKKILMSLFLAGVLSAEIVVVVNPASGVDSLSVDQVKHIFLGKVKSFPNGTASVPVDQNADKATYSEFYDIVAHKDISAMNKYWVKLTFTGKGEAPQKVGSDGDVIGLVKNNKNMIGYVKKSAVTPDVKVVYTVQ